MSTEDLILEGWGGVDGKEGGSFSRPEESLILPRYLHIPKVQGPK